MWNYERHLMYPVQITKPNLDYAKYLVTAIGSYAGELGAALRYLNQIDTMPTVEAKALLTDIGTEAPEMFLSGANAFFDAFATV